MLQTFFLKNMLSNSCIRLVELFFERIPEVETRDVKIGEVQLEFDPLVVNPKKIKAYFLEIGFEVVENPDAIMVERIKQAAIELIHLSNNTSSLIRNSDYISQKLQLSYDKISKVFSKMTGTTIEKYIILLKIEKAKEMLSTDEYSISEISYLLGYSSVQYLSNQFKKTLGITISEFKEKPVVFRKPIEDLLA